MDCKGCYAYQIRETWEILQNRMHNPETGDVFSNLDAETGRRFNFDNAKYITHDCFKGERLVEEALHLGPRTASRCVLVPVQCQAI